MANGSLDAHRRKELEHMSDHYARMADPHEIGSRRSYGYMREYMREYRQGKLRGHLIRGHPASSIFARRENLKMSHRLESFKWRLSRLLNSQYEILLCVEYKSVDGMFKNGEDDILGYDEEIFHKSKEVLAEFPILKQFKAACNAGGSDLFKAIIFAKYTHNFTRWTTYIAVVLDKATLLNNLQKLPNKGGFRWKSVMDKLAEEKRYGEWHELDFSGEYCLSARPYIVGYLARWTTNDRPQWDSSELHRRLCAWAIGNHRLRGWGKYEGLNANGNQPKKLLISPILLQ
jgi:hypothetical protein